MSGSMAIQHSTPTKNIQLIRDHSFFGLKKTKDKKLKYSKPMPYLNVSDDDESETTCKVNGLKRKASMVNGYGHKHKKHRQQSVFENDAGPSQHIPNGAITHSRASKAIQEQRNDLPIAKGNNISHTNGENLKVFFFLRT